MKWKTVPFSELYAIPSKNGLTKPQRVRGNGYKMVNMGELFNNERIYDIPMERVPLLKNEKKAKLEPLDLLFARQSLVASGAGQCSIVMETDALTVYESHLIRVRLNKEKANPLFYFYYFRSPLSPMPTIVQQCAQAGIRAETLGRLEVLCPDIDTQNKIVEILEPYNRLIENHRRQIALLEEAAQRIYTEWFVDLHFPGAESSKITNGLPDGWRRLPFFPTIEIMSGGTPSTSKPDYYRGNIPFFTPKDCGDHFFAFDTEKHISEDGLKHCNSQLYPKNTIVITARGTVGKVILLGVPMAMNQSCFAFRSDEIASPYFLYFLLRHASDELRIKANGGVFDTITIRSFNDMSVLVPDPKRMNQFLKIITPMMEQMQVFSKETTYLQEARDRLLPRLMAGGDGASSLPR